MSRYFPPPSDYEPGRLFSLRMQPEGGGLRPRVLQTPSSVPHAGRQLIVLVHGFNNHWGEAGRAYQGFRRSVYRTTEGLPVPALERLLADLMWPGDADWWGLGDQADFLVYPAAVGTAKAAGKPLGEHLLEMPNLEIVHFIGHSLGCRLVLETIDLLRKRNRRVGRVCLMAAAVPTFMLERPRGILIHAMRHPEAILVLYSSADLVLKHAFRAGQTVAGAGEGFFPKALGSAGPSADVLGNVSMYKVADAGHGDYWGHSRSRPARISARRASEFLRMGILARSLPDRAAPNNRDSSAGNREIGL